MARRSTACVAERDRCGVKSRIDNQIVCGDRVSQRGLMGVFILSDSTASRSRNARRACQCGPADTAVWFHTRLRERYRLGVDVECGIGKPHSIHDAPCRRTDRRGRLIHSTRRGYRVCIEDDLDRRRSLSRHGNDAGIEDVWKRDEISQSCRVRPGGKSRETEDRRRRDRDAERRKTLLQPRAQDAGSKGRGLSPRSPAG